MVERKHQHILNVARALKFQSGLPMKYWNDFVLTSVFLINRIPTPTLDNKTPFEVLFKRKPVYTDLKVFGCLAFATTLMHNRHKFDPRGRKCVFLGYPFGTKGYKLLDLENNKVFISRNVKFYEDIFPFKDCKNPKYTDESNLNHKLPTPAQLSYPEFINDNLDYPASLNPRLPVESDQESNQNMETSGNQEPDPEPATQPEIPNEPDIPRRSERNKRTPTYLQDFICQQATSLTHSKTSDKKKGTLISGTPFPLCATVSYHKLSLHHKSFVSSILTHSEPTTYQKAIENSEWCKAMKDEIYALELNKTWTVTDLPPGKVPIGCRWVYKVKFNADGIIERYKARLMAKGYTQLEGIDYHETFSPVAKLVTVRTLIAIAAAKGWYLHQFDVNNAFLHGNLEKEVYMEIPPGYSTDHISDFRDNGALKVCKLNKSLYGLKQASRQWYARLSSFIIEQGFQ